MRNRDRELRIAIKQASAAIHSAYVDACDEAGHPLDPRDIGLPPWCCELLAEAYAVLCENEAVGGAGGLPLSRP